jgi:hypothetical protein
MADLSFDEAYETVCYQCHQKAGAHRLTRTGNLYCLKYNQDSNHLDKRNVNIFNVTVKYLWRSPLGKDVGAVLDYNLHSLDNARVPDEFAQRTQM